MDTGELIIIPRSLLEQLHKATLAANESMQSITPEEKRAFLWDSRKNTKLYDTVSTLLFWSEKVSEKAKSPLHIVHTNPQ